jgi:hypothetical protein
VPQPTVIVTRKEALERGLKRYIGKPCDKHGPAAERLTSNGVCVACRNEWRAANIDHVREVDRRRRLARNPDKKREYDKRWRVKHPSLSTWKSMIRRCKDPKHPSFKNYGGRTDTNGNPVPVTVCNEWRYGNGEKSGYECWFEYITAHLGPKPSPQHTLDRINNALGYRPGNMHWADWETQAANRRGNVFIEHNGKKQIVAQWARETGLSCSVIYARYHKGLSPEQILSRGRDPSVALARVKDHAHRGPRGPKIFLEHDGKKQTLVQWARETGLRYITIYARYKNDLPPEQVLAPKRIGRPAAGVISPAIAARVRSGVSTSSSAERARRWRQQNHQHEEVPMLTRKQAELLRFIHECLQEAGVAPSFSEMMDALDLRSKSGIHRLIIALEERGFIHRLPNRVRAIEVIKLPANMAAQSSPVSSASNCESIKGAVY